MLTDNELRLLGRAWLLRQHELPDRPLWFAVDEVEFLAEVDALVRSGWFDREWHGEDMVFRLREPAAQALAMTEVVTDRAQDQN